MPGARLRLLSGVLSMKQVTAVTGKSNPVICFITSILHSTLRVFDLTLTASGKDHKLSNLRSVKIWRVLIDAVDSELLYLLNRRAELAIEAGRAKKSAGLPIWGKPNSAVTSRKVEAVLAVSERFVFETASFLAESGTIPAYGMIQNSSQFQSLKTVRHSTGLETGYLAAHNSSVGFTPICDSERERDVIARMCQANAGPLDNTAIAKSFRRIIRETRRIEMRFAQSGYARDGVKKRLESRESSHPKRR